LKVSAEPLRINPATFFSSLTLVSMDMSNVMARLQTSVGALEALLVRFCTTGNLPYWMKTFSEPLADNSSDVLQLAVVRPIEPLRIIEIGALQPAAARSAFSVSFF